MRFVRGVAYEREEELLESFSRAARGLLEDGSLAEALDGLAEAAATATGSDVVIVRTIAPEDGCLLARAVRAESPALAAELEPLVRMYEEEQFSGKGSRARRRELRRKLTEVSR